MVSLFSMDNWFLAMDFISYAVENGLKGDSNPSDKCVLAERA